MEGHRVIGSWRTVTGTQQALVEMHVGRPLDAATRSALEGELARYGRFLQLPVRLAMPKAGNGRRAPARK
jgi:hypothetical protein